MNLTLSHHFQSFEDRKYIDYKDKIENAKKFVTSDADIRERFLVCEKSLDLLEYLVIFVRNVLRMSEESAYLGCDIQLHDLCMLNEEFATYKENLIKEVFREGRENELPEYEYMLNEWKRFSEYSSTDKKIGERSYRLLDQYQKEVNVSNSMESLADIFSDFYTETITTKRVQILKERLYKKDRDFKVFEEMYIGIKNEQLQRAYRCGFSNPRYFIDDEFRIGHNVVDYLEIKMKEYKWKGLFAQTDNKLLDVLYPTERTTTRYSYQEAMNILKECFSKVFPQMGKMIERAYCESWIDWEERKGKLLGNYTNIIHYTGESLITMTYSGTLNDICKLAHELGHAYHGYLLSQERYYNADFSIISAEIFGVFCENYILVYLAQNSYETTEIMEYLKKSVISILTGNALHFMFERNSFVKLKETTNFSVNKVFYQTLCDIFGKDNVDKNQGYEFMWISRAQNFFPENYYYNYVYIIGEFISLELIRKLLYRTIKSEHIELFLKYSGKDTIDNLLQQIDVDLLAEWMYDVEKQYDDIYCAVNK